MKKIAFFILGLAFSSSFSAQNSNGNLHIVNNHLLDLYYTINTVDIVNNCTSYKSVAPATSIAQGNDVICVKYEDMENTSWLFPYPNTISGWTDPANPIPYQIPISSALTSDTVWDRIDFELNDASNYSSSSPLTSSVGFVSSCISSNASVVTGSGTLNGNNYDFKAEAFTMGGDYWVIVK